MRHSPINRRERESNRFEPQTHSGRQAHVRMWDVWIHHFCTNQINGKVFMCVLVVFLNLLECNCFEDFFYFFNCSGLIGSDVTTRWRHIGTGATAASSNYCYNYLSSHQLSLSPVFALTHCSSQFVLTPSHPHTAPEFNKNDVLTFNQRGNEELLSHSMPLWKEV